MGLGRYLDSCGNCMKYSLFFVNLLIFIGGLVVVGLGVWVAVDKSFGTKLLGSNLYIGAIYIIIGAAAVVSVIACFGCFGAAQEVRCMLVTYFIFTFLIFVTMLVGCILLYVFRYEVETVTRKGMWSTINTYNTSAESKEAWDEIQEGFQCCGVDGPANWGGSVPKSCCPLNQWVANYCTTSTAYQKGCLVAWPNFIKRHAAIVGGVGIGLVCIMILAMIFSCALFKMLD